jgi:hypothetical protein
LKGNEELSGSRWLTLAILATREAEIRGEAVLSPHPSDHAPHSTHSTSSPAAVDTAGLGLEGDGQRGLVIVEGDVITQAVGA